MRDVVHRPFNMSYPRIFQVQKVQKFGDGSYSLITLFPYVPLEVRDTRILQSHPAQNFRRMLVGHLPVGACIEQ